MSERSFKIPEGRELSDVEFVRPSQLAESGFKGVILEGTYVGSITNPKNATKLDFRFELDDGSIKIVNGAGNLAYKMKFIEPGTYCQVQYLGMQEIKKGQYAGTESHNFEVLEEE